MTYIKHPKASATDSRQSPRFCQTTIVLYARPQGELTQRALGWYSPRWTRMCLCCSFSLPPNWFLLTLSAIRIMVHPKYQLRYKFFEKRIVVSR